MSASLVANTANLACHLASSDGRAFDLLAFFTDLLKSSSGKQRICDCKEVPVGDLPIVADVTIYALNSDAKIVVEKLAHYKGSRQLTEGVQWSLEGSMLRIDVDISSFADATGAKPAGKSVVLVKVNKAVPPVVMIGLVLKSTGGAAWPALVSPGRVASSVRDASEALTPSRRLVMDGQTPMTDDLHRRSDLEGGATFFGRALFVDPTDRQRVRIVFYPNSYDGNVFTTDLTVFDVAVKLTIEYLEEEDARVRRLREKRALAQHKVLARNATTEEGVDGTRGEPVVTIYFDADQDLGPIELDDMFHSTGSKSVRAILVSECKALCGNLDVRLTATRAALEIPTEQEVYVAVRSYLFPVGKDFGQVELDQVREYVLSQYPSLFRASRDQRQAVKQMTWSCARQYMINTMLDLPETIVEDDVIRGIIPSR